ADRGLLECPVCGSSDVRKAIMAPAVARGVDPVEQAAKYKRMRQFFTAMRKHVEENGDYVGEKFPDEARAIHYGDAEERQIYGEATLEDARDLLEEGITVLPLPPEEKQDS
ncbi:MAG TPA: DUF1178 domain-containing protein, partial [Alphaproteobacteria bacterium]|nr:DUF1178 domain-containing protein [Alphaproteobacteria bacterium]